VAVSDCQVIARLGVVPTENRYCGANTAILWMLSAPWLLHLFAAGVSAASLRAFCTFCFCTCLLACLHEAGQALRGHVLDSCPLRGDQYPRADPAPWSCRHAYPQALLVFVQGCASL